MDRSVVAQTRLNERRLFASGLDAGQGEIALSADSAKHAQVLRLGVGDEVVLFDGEGGDRLARITSLTRASLRCMPLGALRKVERGPEVVLVQCLPKGAKLDEIVRMTTELGVAEIRLAVSTRCVSRADEERSAGKIERLSRIAIEAARQSEQPFVPRVIAPQPLTTVLAQAPADAVKLAYVERHDEPLAAVAEAGAVWVVVGPEGGLGTPDLEALQAAGFISAGLGRAILRTETAAVVGVALVLDRLRQRR